MDIFVSSDFNGLLVNNPEKFKRIVSKSVNEALVKGGNFMLAALKRATPVGATGALRLSWVMDIVGNPNQGKMIEINIYSPSKYLRVVDQGRKAGPVSREGIKSLQLWVKRKLGVTGEAKSLGIAFAIAQKKKTQDTPGQFFVQRTIDQNMDIVVDMIIEPSLRDSIEGGY